MRNGLDIKFEMSNVKLHLDWKSYVAIRCKLGNALIALPFFAFFLKLTYTVFNLFIFRPYTFRPHYDRPNKEERAIYNWNSFLLNVLTQSWPSNLLRDEERINSFLVLTHIKALIAFFHTHTRTLAHTHTHSLARTQHALSLAHTHTRLPSEWV